MAATETSRAGPIAYGLGLWRVDPKGMLAVLAGHAGQVASNLVIASITRRMLDAAVTPGHAKDVAMLAATAALVLAGRWAFGSLGAHGVGRVSSASMIHVVERLLLAIHRIPVPPPELDETRLRAALGSELSVVHALVGQQVPTVVYQVLNVSACLALAFVIDVRLATFVTVLVACAAGVITWTNGRAASNAGRTSRAFSTLGQVGGEDVEQRRIVAEFGASEFRIQAIAGVIESLRDPVRRSDAGGETSKAVTSATAAAIITSVVCLGAYFVSRGELSPGALFAMVSMTQAVTGSATGLSFAMPALTRARSAVELFQQIEALGRPEGSSGIDAHAREGVPSRIEATDILVEYANGKRALHGVTLAIDPGTYVAIVGPSGSGKSTLLRVLLGRQPIVGGRVSVAGRSVNDLAEAQAVAVVDQDPRLFDLDIRQNLLMARADATDEELLRHLESAAAASVVTSSPEGLSRSVGPSGSALSGGQRQRVVLARALLRSPSVLVLDEATSALDAESEASVVRVIESLRGRATTISVTHRLSTCIPCDRIFVLADGRLVEQGTHDELLERGGTYASMFRIQSGLRHDADGRTSTISENALAAIPVFAGLPPEVLRDLVGRFVPIHVRAGTELVRRGDLADAFYVVVDGSFSVSTHGDVDSLDRRLVRGDFFGELGLVRRGERTATVVAQTDGEVLALFGAHFLAVYESSEELRGLIDARVVEHERRDREAIGA